MHDSHTHSVFSDDGMDAVQDIILKAAKLKCDYIAITDHCNRDYQVIGYDNPQINMNEYVKALEEIKAKVSPYIRVAMGIELGYMKQANNLYMRDLYNKKFDVIINSVHCVNGSEVYFADYFNKCPFKHYAYLEYLKAIRESLDAPYDYDIIGHIGYIQRNAPYPDPDLNYKDYMDILDDILSTIIKKDKCLEVNSKTYRGGSTTSDFSRRHISIPDVDIVRRYYELGGKKISFGSDAHRANNLCYNYNTVANAMQNIGFKGFTRYMNRTPELVPFDK